MVDDILGCGCLLLDWGLKMILFFVDLMVGGCLDVIVLCYGCGISGLLDGIG